MIWTKLKKTLEERLCPSLKGRVHYYCTRYGPGLSYCSTRVWITLDRKELVSFSTPTWDKQRDQAAREIVEAKGITGGDQDEHYRRAFWAARDEAAGVLEQQHIYDRDEFEYAAEGYVTLSIDDALKSTHVIIRALAMFDRRLGKRRLRELNLGENDFPLVTLFYRVRCEAEGIGAQ
ncbi:MAG: hypothetical protein M1305_02425 [Candidatus Marsarchaeota archaeon]|nr:hypothetical protein [Candidatus Marsarchaeota archaeon]